MHLQGHLVSEQQETPIEGPHFEKKATLNSYNTAETGSNAKDQDHPPEDTQKWPYSHDHSLLIIYTCHSL